MRAVVAIGPFLFSPATVGSSRKGRAAVRTIVYLIGILSMFSFWDLLIRVRMIVNLPSMRRDFDRMSVRISRMIFATGSFGAGMRTEYEVAPGVKLPERFLLIVNHQSLLDIPLLIKLLQKRRLRFVGKRELFKYILLVSLVFRTMRHGCIDRHRNYGATVQELIRLARQSEREGNSIVVFPEGHRAREGELLPFHSGAIRTILRTSPLPVVTAAIDGGYRVSTLLEVLRNIAGLTYRVKILAVHPAPVTKEELAAILSGAQRDIEATISGWRRRYPVPAC